MPQRCAVLPRIQPCLSLQPRALPALTAPLISLCDGSANLIIWVFNCRSGWQLTACDTRAGVGPYRCHGCSRSAVSTYLSAQTDKEPQEVLSAPQETLFPCEGDRALAQVAQEGFGVSHLGDTRMPSGRGPGQLAVGGPARGGAWTRWTLEVPSNLSHGVLLYFPRELPSLVKPSVS